MNIVSLIQKSHTNEDKFNMACPICERKGKDDKKKALYVNRGAGYYRCFRCGVHGLLGNISSGDLWLRDSGKLVAPGANKIELPKEFLSYDQIEQSRDDTNDEPTHLACTSAIEYANKRAVGRDLAREYGIGFCLYGPKAGRIVVPIIGGPSETETYGYVARDFTGWSDYPYLYPKGMSRGITFYNFGQLAEDTEEPLLVMEGVLDCMPHLPHSVAVMGMPSSIQMEQLAQCIRPVVFVLDGDAWEQAEMLAWKLKFLGGTSGFVKLPPKIDPDEIPREDLMDMALKSLSAI